MKNRSGISNIMITEDLEGTDPNHSNDVMDESCLEGKSLEQVHTEYFSNGKTFHDRKTLDSFCDIVGEQYDFYHCIRREGVIECSQGSKRISRSKGVHTNPATSMKINCPWEIRFSSTTKKRDKNGKKRDNFAIDQEIVIRSSNSNHTCGPNPNKRMWIISRNGDLLKEYLTPSAMFLLAHHLQDLPKTCFRTLRNILSKMFPASIVWTGWRICNVRRFILGKIKHMENNNGCNNFIEFQKQFSKSEFHRDLKKVVTEEDSNKDIAYDIWKESINSDDGSGSNLAVQMEGMKTSIPGFDFRFAKNSAQEILGVVWMTDVMRANVLRAPENLSLDMRHAKTNHLLWPYVACVFRDTDMKISVGVEGFVCRESVDLYKYIVDSLFDMAPLSNRGDVLVVHADGRLNQTIVTNDLRLPNARFVEDHWHIINTKFPKDYGFIYENNMRTFNGLLNSRSEEQYLHRVDEIKTLLSNRRSLLDKFEEFITRKEFHAWHIVTKLQGSFGKVSSTPSEQNHSSIQAWQGKYYACIVSSIHNLYMRHLHRVALACTNLFQDDLKLEGMTTMLTGDERALLLAAKVLNLTGYKLFRQELEQAVKYEVLPVDGDLNKSKIRNMDQPESTGTVICHDTGHCTECDIVCAHRFFYCKHTIVYVCDNSPDVNLLNIRIEKSNIARRYWKQTKILRLTERRGKYSLVFNFFKNNIWFYKLICLFFQTSR